MLWAWNVVFVCNTESIFLCVSTSEAEPPPPAAHYHFNHWAWVLWAGMSPEPGVICVMPYCMWVPVAVRRAANCYFYLYLYKFQHVGYRNFLRPITQCRTGIGRKKVGLSCQTCQNRLDLSRRWDKTTTCYRHRQLLSPGFIKWASSPLLHGVIRRWPWNYIDPLG